MSGVKGKSGRKKTPSNQIKAALEALDADIPELFRVLVDKAKAGDKDCLIYLLDRRMGRPHQSIDQRIKVKPDFSADDYELASRVPLLAEQTLLAQYGQDSPNEPSKEQDLSPDEPKDDSSPVDEADGS